MTNSPVVLVVDDDASLRQTMGFIVEHGGMKSVLAETGRQALEICERSHIDVILLDVQLPDINGIEVLAEVRRLYPEIEVIVVTVVKENSVQSRALALGASEFVTKDFEPSELNTRIGRALQLAAEKRQLARLKAEAERTSSKGMVFGRSRASIALQAEARLAAASHSNVLISGETGTGKNVLARWIHENSARRNGPFNVVTLTNITKELAESTLFGHERGAFTGATERFIGEFEQAEGGTIVLDEIGDAAPELQAKLLRVLEEREFKRLGSSITRKLNVRLICSTNKDLTQEVAQKRFRKDLFWRLYIMPITVPPLRARVEDIGSLAEHFLERSGREIGRPAQVLSPASHDVLRKLPWSGNVRELRNAMDRLLIISQSPVIEPSELPEFIQAFAPAPPQSFKKAMKAYAAELIRNALTKARGDKQLAARLLDLPYSTFCAKCVEHGIDDDSE